MSDKVIQFPGSAGGNPPEDQPEQSAEQSEAGGLGGLLGGHLSEDQEKALQVIMSGMSYVCIGIKPTESGADFFTAVDGDAKELTDAAPHLDGVITRALQRKGLL